MTNSITGLDSAQELLIKLVEQNPDDWDTRKKVVQVLYDAGYYHDASKMVWSAPEIPPVGQEVIFAARIVSKGQPTRATRLFDTVILKNAEHPEENLAMAKQLVIAGMPYQALRFYGAATALDTELVDEDFELCIVQADTESKNWCELIKEEAFPWDGPEESVISKQEEDDVATDPHAELMNGATQPVPMMAPMREKAQRSNELPNWRVEKVKTSYVSSERLTPSVEEEAEQAAPVSEVTPPVASVVVSAPVSPAPAPALAPEPPAMAVPPVMEAPKPAQSELPMEPAKEEASFYKSYDDAHEHRVRPPESVEVETPQASDQVKTDDSLSDYVTDVLSQIGEDQDDANEQPSSKNKGRMGGVFSSFMKKMRHRSDDESLDESAVEGDMREAIYQTSDPEPEPQAEVPVAPPALEETPVETPPVPPVVAPSPVPAPSGSTMVQKAEPAEHRAPKELDGRTQLVALAPVDGSSYFDGLLGKYRDLPAGETPRPVLVARDMANIDYLKLIHEACNKDVDAFSKLLGLHRVMSGAQCSEWCEDMNLLRKGYGDAVLATVVSRYSVAECREILNSVYSYPVSQAAAG